MPAFIARTEREWLEQADRAERALRAQLPPDTGPVATRDLASVDRDQFGLLVEALWALGLTRDPELARLAGLVPVDQALGFPAGRLAGEEDP
jgi:hypothetical protein